MSTRKRSTTAAKSSNEAGALDRLASALARIEALLPPATGPAYGSIAFRWRKRRYFGVERGQLEPVAHPALIAFADLQHVEAQKEAIRRNTEQFVRGLPANNVLLTGARGTGKSSLIRACLHAFAGGGLRLVEVDKRDLVDLADLVALLEPRKERFIVYCDDLSFDASEAGYKELKAALDGSVAGQADNVLIYATSNRRHLMPEFMRDNLAAQYQEDGEVHPGEAVEERVSLSERFGLWLTFYPFRQDDYLDIVAHWLAELGVGAGEHERAKAEALQFALQRGSRSGRVALQFARDYAGRHLLHTSRKR
ncbi:MAG TPA: ATP-binding protein [Burkholderiaceae bacterium]|nr:ATP-binding protein [Burkholderiaceae bacterium]HQR72560.1 ATP-binding protein [Burkholderiaceae bacterium]